MATCSDSRTAITASTTLHRPADASLSEISPSWTARQILVFSLLSFVYFLNWNCFGLLVSFFPSEASKYGMSSTTVGLIFGMYNLVGFFGSFFYGLKIIPKVGPYFVLNAGLFVNGGANIAFGFLNLLKSREVFTAYCFVVRGVGALGGAACDIAIFVIVTREFRGSLETINGFLEFFTGLGSALGPVIGGSLYSLGGFRLPLLLTGGLLLVSLPLVWLFLPRKVYTTEREDNTTIKMALSIPGVFVICLSSFVHVCAVSSIDPILQPFAAKFGINPTGVGLLFLCFSVTYMICTPLTGCILHKKPLRRVLLVFSSLVTAFFLMVIGPAPFVQKILPNSKVLLLSVAMGIGGIGDAVFFVPVLPEIHHYFKEKGIGKGPRSDSLTSGLYTGFYNLGSFVGPVVGGLMADYLGFQWTATIMAFLILGQTVILIMFFSIERKRGMDESTDIVRSNGNVNNSINSRQTSSYGSIGPF